MENEMDNQSNLPKLSPEELINRAIESEKAIAQEKVISLEELEEEMKAW